MGLKHAPFRHPPDHARARLVVRHQRVTRLELADVMVDPLPANVFALRYSAAASSVDRASVLPAVAERAERSPAGLYQFR